jgi:hypothetical protein
MCRTSVVRLAMVRLKMVRVFRCTDLNEGVRGLKGAFK